MGKGVYIGVNNVARKVKNIYVGVPSVMITNMLQAMDGNDGFSSGSSSSITTKYSPRSLLLTGTTRKAEIVTQTNQLIYLDPTHLYYARVEIYQITEVGGTSIYWPIAEPNFYSGKKAIAGQWTIASAVNHRNSFAAGFYPFRLDFDNNYQNGTMYFDGAMLIDLTSSFGEGREPTAEWCDLNIPYFTGSMELKNPLSTSVARRIPRAYIGIGGVARPLFDDDPVSYFGTTTALSESRVDFAATTIGDYAIFAGGYTARKKADAYDQSLTRVLAPDLSVGKHLLAATTVGDYAIFGGGETEGSINPKVDAYTSSLTRIDAPDLSVNRRDTAATTIGNYAIFAGGIENKSGLQVGISACDAYDSSLTRVDMSSLSSGRNGVSATTIGDYAIFAGGGSIGSSSSTVDAYNSYLTRVNAPSLSVKRSSAAATTVGNYAIFAAGDSGTTVDAYNSYLTRVNAPSLSVKRSSAAATTVGNYAIFAGGDPVDEQTLFTSDVYNSSLGKIVIAGLEEERNNLVAATVGNYALFAGGKNGNYDQKNTVYVYKLMK